MITEILNVQDKMQIDAEIEAMMRDAIKVALETSMNCTDYEISVAIVDNVEIEKLNLTYRNIAAPTDVLSFPMDNDLEELPLDMEPDDELLQPDELVDIEMDMEMGQDAAFMSLTKVIDVPMLGDIIISIEKADEQAKEYGHSLVREMCYLTVHGVLHLVGYDHETDEDRKVMRDLEETVLDSIGLTR